MRNTFSLLFYIRRDRIKKNGKASIMVRITINSKEVLFSTRLDIEPEFWNPKTAKVEGKSIYAQQINNGIDNIRASLIKEYHKLYEFETNITAEKLRNTYLGYEPNRKTLLQLFDQQNKNAEKIINKGLAKSTVDKYKLSQRRTEEFLKTVYNISDIDLMKIDNMFIVDFDNYLKSNMNCSFNTVSRYMRDLKKIILLAKNNGWLKCDPFINYKIRFKHVDRGFLTQKEIEALMSLQINDRKLREDRDVFLFACFTGLAFCDIKSMTKQNIQTLFDEDLWLVFNRNKTKIKSDVPLLEIPLMIIDKYSGILKGNNILPVSYSQKINKSLKKIATLCNIPKRISFHMARHTFATTLTLSKGVPIETVSKMLGHTSIKTTQIYARITNEKVRNDMKILSGKLKDNFYTKTGLAPSDKII